MPHITAADTGSLGFGYGYAFAEDHLCSLADVVVQVRSEAASFFGAGSNDRWLDQDIVYAGLELYDRAGVEFDNAQTELQDAVRGYAAGYNAYLSEVGADAVPGYCQGADWVRPIDEYDLAAYYKSLTWRASIDPLLGYIADAEPPGPAAPEATDVGTEPDEEAVAFAAVVPDAAQLGSNAWAIGTDRTVDGTTMLVGNPHFPWQGALRFYEVHLTIPGEVNVYGASLLGVPVVNIGFNEDVAWSHTVSNGHRFTAYTLDLVEGDPTRYVYGDDERAMTPSPVTIEVLQDDGTVEVVNHTVWLSHYGPVLSFPGVGWTDGQTISIRDANADNDEVTQQWWDMNTATSMDELIEAHADNMGIPWVNTVAASADGRIWYADTSSTPNLSPEAIAAWQDRLETDPITGIAYDNGFVLLDGSDPLYEWVDDPEARDPGLVPFAAMPRLERTDFVVNANDAYHWTNPYELIPEVSPLHGRLSAPSARTRMNVTMVDTVDGGAGGDGLFTADELRDAALANRVLTAELLVDDVVARCEASPEVTVGDETVDLAKACEVLAAWDRRVDLDSRGAMIWREFLSGFDRSDLSDQGELFADAADPDDFVNTPSTLADGDAVLDNLAAAVLTIEAAGFPLDAPLGDVQFSYRGGVEVPIHGSLGPDGVTNAVAAGSNGTTSEPDSDLGEVITDGGLLRTDGYPIANGTSFIYALEFTADGPVAHAFLTYGNTGDPTSEYFADQTRAFSAKEWRPVAFTDDDIADTTIRVYAVTR